MDARRATGRRRQMKARFEILVVDVDAALSIAEHGVWEALLVARSAPGFSIARRIPSHVVVRQLEAVDDSERDMGGRIPPERLFQRDVRARILLGLSGQARGRWELAARI